MSVRSALLARARLAAIAAMVDACTIRRPTTGTRDDFSGTVTPGHTTVYTGRCRIQQTSPQSQGHDVGEDDQLLLHLEVQLPTTVVGVQVGDEVTVTESQDPDLPDRVFLVRDLAHKTEASARRVQVTERTS